MTEVKKWKPLDHPVLSCAAARRDFQKARQTCSKQDAIARRSGRLQRTLERGVRLLMQPSIVLQYLGQNLSRPLSILRILDDRQIVLRPLKSVVQTDHERWDEERQVQSWDAMATRMVPDSLMKNRKSVISRAEARRSTSSTHQTIIIYRSLYSYRRGGSQAALLGGCSVQYCQLVGGWSSSQTVEQYLSNTPQKTIEYSKRRPKINKIFSKLKKF